LARYRDGRLSLDHILTGDEKWILYANIVRRREWIDRGALPSSTARAGLHPKKIMLCVWWDSEGVVHWEMRPMGMTINAEVYCEQLERVQIALQRERAHREKVSVVFGGHPNL